MKTESKSVGLGQKLDRLLVGMLSLGARAIPCCWTLLEMKANAKTNPIRKVRLGAWRGTHRNYCFDASRLEQIDLWEGAMGEICVPPLFVLKRSGCSQLATKVNRQPYLSASVRLLTGTVLPGHEGSDQKNRVKIDEDKFWSRALVGTGETTTAN
jgi:hypothetical protein